VFAGGRIEPAGISYCVAACRNASITRRTSGINAPHSEKPEGLSLPR
jgi:hypothetical protein